MKNNEKIIFATEDFKSTTVEERGKVFYELILKILKDKLEENEP